MFWVHLYPYLLYYKEHVNWGTYQVRILFQSCSQLKYLLSRIFNLCEVQSFRPSSWFKISQGQGSSPNFSFLGFRIKSCAGSRVHPTTEFTSIMTETYLAKSYVRYLLLIGNTMFSLINGLLKELQNLHQCIRHWRNNASTWW